MNQDPPAATDLLAAVREFLEGDVLGSVEGRMQFMTRVAVNVLGIVERELALGPDAVRAHRARLEALGFDDDRALAEAIRRGDVDDRFAEVVGAVHNSVRAKLAIANPRYADE